MTKEHDSNGPIGHQDPEQNATDSAELSSIEMVPETQELSIVPENIPSPIIDIRSGNPLSQGLGDEQAIADLIYSM